MAAMSSMRLLVVCGSEPYSSFACSPNRRRHAQPPRPGFPLQAPSVMRVTFFKRSSRGSCGEFSLEKSFDCIENLRRLRRPVDFDAQLGAVAHAVGEICRELLHLADRVGGRLVAPQRVIRLNILIAVMLR